MMWNVKWLSAFLCIVNIRCSMLVGNYREPSSTTTEIGSAFVSIALIYVRPYFLSFIVPETRSPHDLSNSIWHELSSPYTESSDESVGETTTHVHEPFFEENSTQINVTTQLGSDVYLHCRVNDLREKMVSSPADAARESLSPRGEVI